MSVKVRCDFMIVGQGLAGCLLAQALEQRGSRCVVVGRNLPLAATPVAAGIMNPVTGRRLAKSWRAEEFLPYAKEFYRKLGHEWGISSLLHEGHILRFPKSEKELSLFRSRKQDPAFAPFLGQEFPPDHWAERSWIDPLGSYEIRGVSWVDLEKVASMLRDDFRRRRIIMEEDFEHQDMKINEDGARWGEVKAKRVVFCEGARVTENPWFQSLPFEPSRGETLELETAETPTDHILQSGIWLLSSPDGLVRAGSTYDHENLASAPTVNGREQILEGLAGFLGTVPVVVGQRCGLRTSARDRLPVMGHHPERSQIALFNGFGSKGAAWIPPLADHFAEHLMDRVPLDGEVDLLRFTKRSA